MMMMMMMRRRVGRVSFLGTSEHMYVCMYVSMQNIIHHQPIRHTSK